MPSGRIRSLGAALALLASAAGCRAAGRTVHDVPVRPTSPALVECEWKGRRSTSAQVGVRGYIRGLGHGHFTFAVPRDAGKPLTGLLVEARLSSAFKRLPVPPDGYSDVRLTVNGVDGGTRRAGRHDFRGTVCRWSVADPERLATIAKAREIRLTFAVPEDGKFANGLAVYGGEVLTPGLARRAEDAGERIGLRVTLYHEGRPEEAEPGAEPEDQYMDLAKLYRIVRIKNPVDGSRQTALICLPRGYDKRKPAGLILHHHPYGWKHDHPLALRTYVPLASKHNLIIASSDYHGNAWANELDMADCEALYQYCVRNHEIDPDRVYAHGMSLGGAIATYVGMHPERFAAMAVVHGCLDQRMVRRCLQRPGMERLLEDMEDKLGGPPGPAYEAASGLPKALAGAFRDIPVLLWHGEADFLSARISTRFAEAVNNSGGQARAILTPGLGHDYWIADLDEMFAFFQRNPRGKRNPNPFGKPGTVERSGRADRELVLYHPAREDNPAVPVPTRFWGVPSQVSIERVADGGDGLPFLRLKPESDGIGSVTLHFDKPLDFSPYHALVIDLSADPTQAETEAKTKPWLPIGLFVEDAATVNWRTSFRHDSRLGIAPGADGRLVLPVRALIAAHLNPKRIIAVNLQLPAGRMYELRSVRLMPDANPRPGVATWSADGPAMAVAGRRLLLDLNRGGALVKPYRDRRPPLRPGEHVSASSRLVGPYFEILNGLYSRWSSAEGAGHAHVNSPERGPTVSVTGGLFGHWPKPHVDVGSVCSFSHDFAEEAGRPERDDDVLRIGVQVRFERAGEDRKDIESCSLVWPLGDAPWPKAKHSASEDGKAFTFESPDGRLKVRLKCEQAQKGVFERDAMGLWRLRMPLGLLKDGTLPKGARYEGRFELEIEERNPAR